MWDDKAPIQLKKSFKVLDRDINASKESIKNVLAKALGINPAEIRVEHDQADQRYTKLTLPMRDDAHFKAKLDHIVTYDSQAGLPSKMTVITNKANIRIADSNLAEIVSSLSKSY
jgi:hypothetical protein